MKRLLYLSLFGISIMAVVMVAGCDDDDDNGTGPDFNRGDTTTAEFFIARELLVSDWTSSVEGMSAVLLQLVPNFLDTIDSMGVIAAPARNTRPDLALQDTVNITYNDESGYWYRYQESTEDGALIVLEDSIGFFDGDSAVQFPDSATVDSARYGMDLFSTVDEELVWTADQDLVLTGDIFGRMDVMVNGTQEYEYSAIYSDTTDSCDFLVDAVAVLDDVQTELNEIISLAFCPASGRATYTADVVSTCASDTTEVDTTGTDVPRLSEALTGTWRVAATFSGDAKSYLIDRGDTRWAISRPCVPEEEEEVAASLTPGTLGRRR